jgi:phosphoribosyl-AMP cyclohydrolase / phosphoribosyl-ATP pyrophosphohydrolase
MAWTRDIRFDERGLVPVIAQDARTGEVLMLAWANLEALDLTRETGRAHYWSRSRGSLWAKGDSSGHRQDVLEIRVDCDADAVLYRVEQTGPACHTGERSCFHRAAGGDQLAPAGDARHVLVRMRELLAQRWAERPSDSYTTYLYDRGADKILKKIGEETAEAIIAAKNGSEQELASETADLLFHLMALWEAMGMPFEAVYAELERRFGAPPRPGSTTERPRRSSVIDC